MKDRLVFMYLTHVCFFHLWHDPIHIVMCCFASFSQFTSFKYFLKMLSNRMTFQRFVVRNITEDRVWNSDLRCLHAFLSLFHLLFISLTNLFSPFFPVQTSHWMDMLCKLALKGTTWQAPKKKINTENNEQATRQQNILFST